MLVAVNEVVIGGIVKEDEAKPHRESSNAWADPGEMRIGGPCENEKADWHEPAANHHWVETSLSGSGAVMLARYIEVVFVDKGRAKARRGNLGYTS